MGTHITHTHSQAQSTHRIREQHDTIVSLRGELEKSESQRRDANTKQLQSAHEFESEKLKRLRSEESLSDVKLKHSECVQRLTEVEQEREEACEKLRVCEQEADKAMNTLNGFTVNVQVMVNDVVSGLVDEDSHGMYASMWMSVVYSGHCPWCTMPLLFMCVVYLRVRVCMADRRTSLANETSRTYVHTCRTCRKVECGFSR